MTCYCLSIQNPKDPTKTTTTTTTTTKLLAIIHKFSKVGGNKLNLQKSVAYLHTDNELSERKTNKTTPFTVTLKKNYLEINLMMKVK